jgi:hypothetical protein
MKSALIAIACIVALQLVGSRTASEIQKADPQKISPTEVFGKIRQFSAIAETGLPKADVIKGVRTFPDTVMAADLLTFEPGGRLVFAPAAGDRIDRVVFVRTLRLIGSGGTITWDRAPMTQRPPAPLGKAPPGDYGGGQGADGNAGPDGQPGNPGYSGRNAPTLYIVANRIEGGPLEIDLRGQDGGDGGRGQTGGDGGLGRPGAAALAMLGLCRTPPGTGGNGGRAGNGGRGGEGGRGGNGGTVILLAPEGELEKMASLLYVDVRGGKGGGGGQGGEPGLPGEPGPPGRSEAPCAAGSGGKTGQEGKNGPQGAGGSEGEVGLFVKTALTEQQVRSLQLRGEIKK